MALSKINALLGVARASDDAKAYAVVPVDDSGAYSSTAGDAGELIKTYLVDGSTADMTVDGSSTAVEYLYTVPTGKKLYLYRIMIYLDDSTNFAAELFGGITALTNGVDVIVAGETLTNWKNNIDLTTTMFDTEGRANFGKASQSISGRWTLAKETGRPVLVEAGETVKFVIQDDLTALDNFRATIGGRLVDV